MLKSVLIIGSFLDGPPLETYVSGDLAGRLSSSGWTVWNASRKQNRLARLADMLKTTWVRQRDYCVALIDVFSGPAFIWAEAVAWTLQRLAKPYILTLHGGGLPEFAARWPGRVRRLLNSANEVTSPSEFLRASLAPYCPRIRVIPNPIEVPRYPFRKRSPAQPNLVWLRAFHEMYNPTMAIEVLATVLKSFPSTRLMMVGADRGDGSLQRAASAASCQPLNAHVTFTGRLPKSQIPQVLDRADIFLNTTDVDNTPVSVVEAMACGLCIVSTNVGGMPYLLRTESDALTVAPRDTQAMAQAVGRLLAEPELAGRLSVSARRRAETFDWNLVLPAWEQLFLETANRAPFQGQKPR